MTQPEELQAMVNEFMREHFKAQTGNKSAGVRARSWLGKITKLAKVMRVEVLEMSKKEK